MRMGVVTWRAADDADVGLRLGAVVETDRTLDLDKPAVPERALERLGDEQHRRAVRARLRLLHEEQAVEQLDRVVLVEEALVDQPRVFAASPAMQSGPLRVPHARMLSAASERVNVSGWIRRRRTGYNGTPRRPVVGGARVYKEEESHGTHAARQGV